MSKHPLIGKKAPELSLPNFDGATFTFSPGTTGRPAAVFFYPRSGTYGCTKEACQFRDALSEGSFKTTQIQVIGISPDPVEKQKKFVEKNKLTYPVLSDEKGEARKAYDVGRGFFGLTSGRVTFIIDSEGVVKDVFDSNFKFSDHHKFVHDWLSSGKEKDKSTVPEGTTPASSSQQAAVAKIAEGEQGTAA